MAPFESFSQLLLLPDGQESAMAVGDWLQLARANLEGFRSHPAVLRHTVSPQRASVEARRWSDEEYRALTNPSPAGERLMLGLDGRLTLCGLERIRHLRQKPEERIYDEIFSFCPIEQPTTEHLVVVQKAIISRFYALGFADWGRLNWVQRRRLAAHPAGWQEAAAALKCVSAEQEVETLELFLSEDSHPRLREEVLAAGGRGSLRPSADVVAFLLARTDWNLNPGLVRMARSAAEDQPERVVQLHLHPNPQVRLRLADLLPAGTDWIGWLAVEPQDAVRERLRLIIEQASSPCELVDRLSLERDRNRREALGWLLVHWSRRVERPQDWGAFNRALRSQLGSENRNRLRRKLAAIGKLSLRSRWLGG